MKHLAIILSLSLSLLFAASCEHNNSVDNDSAFSAYQKGASSTSVTVAWVDELSTGGDEVYNVAIYKKSNTKVPYLSFEVEMKATTPRAFTFPLLNPNSDYCVKITNSQNITTEPLWVSTTAANARNATDLYKQGFENLCWGFDYMNNACGVKVSLPKSSAYTSLDDTISNWSATSNPAYDLDLFYFTKSAMKSVLGINEWEGEYAYQRPGYVRLGSSSNGGKLYTPASQFIEDGGCEVIVNFDACQFNLSGDSSTETIKVQVVDQKGSVTDEVSIEIPGYGENPTWVSLSATFQSVKSGDKFAFVTEAGHPLCIDNIHIYRSSDIPDNEIFGHLLDQYGNPVAGVAVSDGFTVVQTNNVGFFHFKPSTDSYYIFYSIPADCDVTTDKHGRPGYFQRYKSSQKEYNFTLQKRTGGKERECLLFGFADPQTGSNDAVARFKKQVVPEVKAYSEKQSLPCYGITLGDVISMGGSTNEEYMFYDMRDAMHADQMGMPVFQVMGNHDNCFMNKNRPAKPDATSSNFNLKIQRPFEDALGPVNFSFNRAGAHIIGMRNVHWLTGDNCATANTKTSFTKEQYEWLAADLALVPKNKMVILCVHVPLYNNGKVGDGTYRQEALNLLDQFAEAHVISGHLHYQRNYDHVRAGSSHKIYEHAQAAVNGASWSSNLNGDGVPNGYEVYHISDNRMKDWYWKGYATGMDDRNYQIRLYRGNAITGAAKNIGIADPEGTRGYYQFGYDENTLLANVFNSDEHWLVEVYEDGEYSGQMTSLARYHWDVVYDELIGTGAWEDPWRPASDLKTGKIVECGRDFWAIGVLLGHLGYNTGGLYYKHCYQMWKFTLKNKNAKIEVRAKDRNGNIYTCSKITEGTDMTYALYNK